MDNHTTCSRPCPNVRLSAQIVAAPSTRSVEQIKQENKKLLLRLPLCCAPIGYLAPTVPASRPEVELELPCETHVLSATATETTYSPFLELSTYNAATHQGRGVPAALYPPISLGDSRTPLSHFFCEKLREALYSSADLADVSCPAGKHATNTTAKS